MLMNKCNARKQIWRRMWFAALVLYVSYFFYRWVGVYTAGVIGDITDGLLYQSDAASSGGLLRRLAVAFSLALLVSPAVDLLTNVLVFHQSLGYEADLIRKVIGKRYETVKSWQAGEWLGRISNDSVQYSQLAVVFPVRMAAEMTVLLVAVAAMIRINLPLAFINLGGLIISTTAQILAKKKNEYFLEGTRKYQDRKRAAQVELMRGHDFLRMLGCEDACADKLRTSFYTYWSSVQKKDLLFGAGVGAVQQFAVAAVFVGSLYLSLIQVQYGAMTTGDFVSIYLISAQIRELMASLLKNFQIMRGYEAQEKRIVELVAEEEPEGTESVPPWDLLRFEKVAYTYPSAQGGMPERSFAVHRQEQIHLEGKNGSGKTTMLNLLCGLFSSRNERIMLDDIPLSCVDLSQWRGKIGYMQQFPDLFPGTVRENIRIGNLNATETQIDSVLEKVGLHTHGDRILSGKKEELSGGEIKRLALARLLLRLDQCELVIMDEPMENLDEAGKRLVHEILDQDTRARIVVSHHNA